ncbi:hypothetical protein PO124_22760 [Bacillus licheniformis]|nr:hypothetical protein [Bacillus licheniformis]
MLKSRKAGVNHENHKPGRFCHHLAVAAIYLALSFNLDSYPYAVIDADVLPKV